VLFSDVAQISRFQTTFRSDKAKDLDTGWRRCIGCLELQVSFRKRATNHRALWRKMTYQDKTSCACSPPCTGHVYVLGLESCSERLSFICMAWLTYACDVTYLYVWHDPFTCVTWLIYMCSMPHWYVWHDTIIFMTRRIHMCDITRLPEFRVCSGSWARARRHSWNRVCVRG